MDNDTAICPTSEIARDKAISGSECVPQPNANVIISFLQFLLIMKQKIL